MSLPVDFDLKERVRASVDIVDVVGQTLELHPAGRNMVARCPWHNDRRPSLTVNPERQTWKCWVCDIGGDIFSYVMQRDGLDFPSALRVLAEQAGIPIDELRGGKKTEPGSPDDKPTLFAAMKLVADAYFTQLESGTSDDAKIARDYLASRGIDEENRKRFRIGFSPESWNFAVDLLRQHDFSAEVAEAAGLAIKRNSGEGHYDRFRGRLMFPIHDLQDRPISLGGRLIPAIAQRRGKDAAGAKYINGPETMLFRKSHQLYNLQLAREAIRRGGDALVMEGYTDVVAARQAGVESAVAVLGTALGEDHIRLLKRFAKRVVLILDGDTAGQTRADQVLELFVRADVDMRVLTLPDGSDPADFLASQGRAAFDALVASAPDALQHKLNRLTDGVDVTHDTHKVTHAIEVLLAIIAQAPRGTSLKIDQLILRMSRTFGLPLERLNERLEEVRKAHAKAIAKRRDSRPRGTGQGVAVSKRTGAPGATPQRSGGSGAGGSRSDAPQSGSNPAAPAGPATTPSGPASNQDFAPTPSFDPNHAFAESAEFDGDFTGDFGGYDDFGGYEDVGGPASFRSQPGARRNAGSSGASDGRSSQPNRPEPLNGIDRELFETLIESPELAAMAVESIDPDWLDSSTAKMLLSAYQDLDFEGRDLTLESLLSILENEMLKEQVSALEQRVRRREGQSTQTTAERYAGVVLRYREREFSAEKTRQIAKLASSGLAEDEEEALLKELFDAERARHEIKKS
ncbi:DNA primase [Novipirellula galeiformis]|uniref:DNA primase n=1 Tax=Novipirellula galeiformis TaxID=2528004 RepID=A0A5C6C7I1_9BACT|nr:DNA primase [Novipirellula galeiformis]TWU20593.1 DNA primase [Novipirellula galeiformis]